MDSAAPTNSRRSERVTVSIPVRLLVYDGSHATAYDARLTDLSLHGAGIYTNATLTPNQIIELVPSEGPRYAVKGRVVWVDTPEAGIELLDMSAGLHWAGQGAGTIG
jgi:PilZ domain-containing protein